MKSDFGQFESAPISTVDLGNVAVIVALCGILGYLRWVKMDTLVLGDTPRWLFEAQREAAGQVPYRAQDERKTHESAD